MQVLMTVSLFVFRYSSRIKPILLSAVKRNLCHSTVKNLIEQSKGHQIHKGKDKNGCPEAYKHGNSTAKTKEENAKTFRWDIDLDLY